MKLDNLHLRAKGQVLQYNKADYSYGEDVGSGTTYLHLKAYKYIDSGDLKTK